MIRILGSLGLLLLTVVAPLAFTAQVWRRPEWTATIDHAPLPPYTPSRWWSDVLWRWARRLWALVAFIFTSILGILVAVDLDPTRKSGGDWWRSVGNVTGVLAWYLLGGFVLHVTFIVWRVSRTFTAPLRQLDSGAHLIAGLFALTGFAFTISLLFGQ